MGQTPALADTTIELEVPLSDGSPIRPSSRRALDSSDGTGEATSVFEDLESNVRYYCRRWPAVFAKASGASIIDETGRTYIDFFSGAGALSYGHNSPFLLEVAIEHLRTGRLVHSLDTYTPEKRAFLEAFRDRILVPRGLDMVVQFVGPTGATAVEAALLLAEQVTGRRSKVAYEGSYHGMTAAAGSISESLGERDHRGCVFLPFVEHCDDAAISRLESALATPIDGQLPGVLVIEPLQADGGARPFARDYLREVRRLCTNHGVVVVADEVQAGNGRTGPFFSFEGSELDPDIICLSKSLSGLGLPIALNLVRRDLDKWMPGQFTGTFRGNNLAFACAAAVIDRYWRDDALEATTARHGEFIRHALRSLAAEDRIAPFTVHGKGLIWGLHFGDCTIADAVATAAFQVGLIIETCGAGDTVKLLPPLTIDDAELSRGLDRLAEAIRLTVASQAGS
jgi:diaminobutyrate-2-oxoglutarate transaminase